MTFISEKLWIKGQTFYVNKGIKAVFGDREHKKTCVLFYFEGTRKQTYLFQRIK